PNANFNGTDSFTYKANDGQLDSNVVTVAISIAPVNDPPVANADSMSTAEDTPLTFAANSLTANDSPGPANENDQTLTVTAGAAEDAGVRTIGFATLLANDLPGPANESGQTLTITAAGNAVGGSVSLSGTDVLFTPAADFNGTASFVYTLQDNGTTAGVGDFK